MMQWEPLPVIIALEKCLGECCACWRSTPAPIPAPKLREMETRGISGDLGAKLILND
jgi:hypothetical protein